MKPIIQKLWMVMAFFCLSISASAYDFKVDGIAYIITSFSDLTCSVAASDMPYEGEIVVPSEVMFKGKTLKVTSISNGAFKSSRVTSVLMSETVVEIEANAFASCEKLNTVVFKEGLQSIGDDAFNGCEHLSNIDFPNSLETIGSAAFAGCKLLSQIVLTTGITKMGASAFMNCENLLKVSLANIVVIEDNVFNGCFNLHEIECGNKLQEIKDYAFANCGFTTFVIPNSVTNIGTSILLNNENLQSFTIGNGINKISSDPIDSCPNIKELIIVDGYNELTLDFSPGNYSLIETDSPTESYEYWDHLYYYTRPGAYSNKDLERIYVGRQLANPYIYENNSGSGSIYYSDKYTLPPFYGNKSIKSVTIGPNVSWIYGVNFSCKHFSFNYGWLEGCSNIETLTIMGLSSIPKFFVKDAIALKAVELPNATLSVEEKAFYNCASLESITFGPKLSTIESDALENCNALASIYCKAKTPPTYSTGFNKDIYLNCKLYIPFETEQSYKSTSPWNNFWNISESQECGLEFVVGDLIYSVTAGNNVIVSGNIVADECDIVIPSHVEYYSSDYNVIGIGESSFKGAPINSIVIPGCVSNIYNDAFNGCSKLKSITMEYSGNAIIIGHKSDLQLSAIAPYPNATTWTEEKTGFREGYYGGLFYGLPIEHLVINRDIELSKYYERTMTMGNYGSLYLIVYNNIVYYPPFYGLKNLKYLEIGGGVSYICKNQIEPVVNAVPTTMEYTNFGKCDSIEVVVSNNPNAPIGGGFSQTVYENASLFLPNGGIDSYKTDDYWKNFAHLNETSFIPIEFISFESDEVTIDVNESKMLNPIFNPSNATIKTLKWSSSQPSIVNVSEDGVVSSSSREGEAIITVTTCDGTNVSASIKIIVQEGAGISDAYADGNLDINIKDGNILISGKSETDIVEIFNIQGQLITSSTSNIININVNGVYLVKIGSVCKKILL